MTSHESNLPISVKEHSSSGFSAVCQHSLEAVSVLYGIGASKDKDMALKIVSQCSCRDCQATNIIALNKRLPKKIRVFSDAELIYAENHAQNSDCCKLLLAIILLKGLRHPEAILLLNELADKDFAVACLFLGNLPYQPITKDKHMQYLEKAHALGAYKATIILGKKAFNRHGTDADNAKSFDLFKKVEDDCFAHALYKLAKWNEEPTGPKNHDEVVRLYSLAAQQGNAKANYKLGLIMSEGKYRLPKNVPQAVEYFSVAADKGNVDAQLALGYIFFEGNGVDKDETKARKYFELASRQGNKWAEIMLLQTRK